ncbi:hypothetical protein LX36DRAFT_749947 [Colletotrichum falcatum]|nr:hypothetical protein LX36DRAFT_749947 [Colletotrichum falcatum]
MRLSTALAVCAAAFAIANPFPAIGSLVRSVDDEQTGAEIAGCEVGVASEQVTCINLCDMDPQCIDDCSTTATEKYGDCCHRRKSDVGGPDVC